MCNLQQDSDSITYEALLLLSYFVFRNVKNQTVRKVLVDNSQSLMDFVDGFRIENRDEEKQANFIELKDRLLSRLRRLQISD
jgi:hypothetical protein